MEVLIGTSGWTYPHWRGRCSTPWPAAVLPVKCPESSGILPLHELFILGKHGGIFWWWLGATASQPGVRDIKNKEWGRHEHEERGTPAARRGRADCAPDRHCSRRGRAVPGRAGHGGRQPENGVDADG